MVTLAELKKLKIDAVEEVHRVREKLAGYSSERIRDLAKKAEGEIERLRRSHTEQT